MSAPRLAARIALGALAVVLVVVAVEGASSVALFVMDVRALRQPRENFRQAAYDSLLGWVPMPNLANRDNYAPGISLTTSADGMRIHRPLTALATGQHRVICSGDSFTFGSGVGDAETFCARLEGELPGVRTLNMAQRGYGIDQAYLRYRRDAARYPHQLHVFAFIWGDFERMGASTFLGYSKPMLTVREGRLEMHNVPVPPWKGWSRWRASMGLLPSTRLMQLVSERVGVSESTKLQRMDARVFGLAEWIFRDLARLGRERGSAQVLVYLPTLANLRPGVHDERRRRVAAFARAEKIPFVDLTDEIRRLPDDSLQWMFITEHQLPVDGPAGHYSAKGHEWIAAHLAAHLEELPEAREALARDSRVASGAEVARE